MTRRLFRPLLLALALAAAALAGWAMVRPDGAVPQAGAEADYECTTCDARAAAKKRQRELLKELRSKSE